MIDKRIVAAMALKVGLTMKEAEKVIETLEQYRLDEGEASYQELTAFAKEAVAVAESDGVPISVLLDSMRRKQ